MIGGSGEMKRLISTVFTGLPLRVLVKPQSNVYLDKDKTSPQIRFNVPAF